MGKATRLINGILRSVDITASVAHYESSILVTTNIGVSGAGYDSTHKIFTLPNSQTYDPNAKELKVKANGVHMVEGVDYDYDFGSAPTATTVEFANAIPKDARVSFLIDGV